MSVWSSSSVMYVHTVCIILKLIKKNMNILVSVAGFCVFSSGTSTGTGTSSAHL